MTPPRFYSLAPWNELSGAPICALDHLRFLDPSRDASCLLLPSDGPLVARADAFGVPCEIVPAFSGARASRIPSPFAFARSRIAFVRRLSALLRSRPGILHIHSLSPLLPLALLAARRARCPAAVTIHEPWNGAPALRFFLACVRRARVPVVFLSEAARRAYPRLPNPSAVIPNAFPPPPPPPPPDNPIPVVALVASLCRNKGVDLFLRIALEIRRLALPARFLLIGPWADAPTRDAALAFIRDNALDGLVSVAGPRPDPASIYPAIDLLLAPSRRDSFPRVVMEAMSYARPVLASAVDGIPEMVGPSLAPFCLAPPEDVPAFVARLLPLLRDPSLRRRLADEARARAETLFAPDAYRSAVLSLYRSAALL